MFDQNVPHIVSSGANAAVAANSDDGAAARESRRQLINVPVGQVQEYRSLWHEKSDELYSEQYRIVFPYKGVCTWHVSNRDVVVDPNQVLFARGGESFRVSGPFKPAYADIILTPAIETVAEIVGVGESRLFDHPLFRNRRAFARPSLQSFLARFLHWATSGVNVAGLEAEELVVALLRRAMQTEIPQPDIRRTNREADRTSETLSGGAPGGSDTSR